MHTNNVGEHLRNLDEESEHILRTNIAAVAIAAEATPQRDDASSTAEALANERMATLIKACSMGGRRQLTEARDRLDDLLRTIDAHGDALQGAVTEYVVLVQQAVEMKDIIMKPVERLAAKIKSDPVVGRKQHDRGWG